MAVRRFTVNVPNPSPQAAKVQLSLRPVPPAQLSKLRLGLPSRSLKVVRATISLEPCDQEGEARLPLRLRPHSSVDVYVHIETAGGGAPGTAAFHLVDRRAGSKEGGVLLVVTDPPLPTYPGQLVPAKKPCAMALKGKPYIVQPGSDPSQPGSAPSPATMSEFDLVVPVTNPTGKPLAEAKVYLEHLGACDAQFLPATWNVGAFQPKEVFFAAWRVRTRHSQQGSFDASVVVSSRGTNAIRMPAQFQVRAGRTPVRLSLRRQH